MFKTDLDLHNAIKGAVEQKEARPKFHESLSGKRIHGRYEADRPLTPYGDLVESCRKVGLCGSVYHRDGCRNNHAVLASISD